MFKIEKGIPIKRDAAAPKYPFANMEPGDSFASEEVTNTRAALVYYCKKNPDKKFTTSARNNGPIRVWRIA